VFHALTYIKEVELVNHATFAVCSFLTEGFQHAGAAALLTHFLRQAIIAVKFKALFK
jgi:hypothetical protein